MLSGADFFRESPEIFVNKNFRKFFRRMWLSSNHEPSFTSLHDDAQLVEFRVKREGITVVSTQGDIVACDTFDCETKVDRAFSLFLPAKPVLYALGASDSKFVLKPVHDQGLLISYDSGNVTTIVSNQKFKSFGRDSYPTPRLLIESEIRTYKNADYSSLSSTSLLKIVEKMSDNMLWLLSDTNYIYVSPYRNDKGQRIRSFGSGGINGQLPIYRDRLYRALKYVGSTTIAISWDGKSERFCIRQKYGKYISLVRRNYENWDK